MPGYWHAHSDLDFEDPLGLSRWREDDDPDAADTRELLHAASVKLHRYLSSEHPGGCVARTLPGEAASLLREAGYLDIAMRVEDACSDREVTGLYNEICTLEAMNGT